MYTTAKKGIFEMILTTLNILIYPLADKFISLL